MKPTRKQYQEEICNLMMEIACWRDGAEELQREIRDLLYQLAEKDKKIDMLRKQIAQ